MRSGLKGGKGKHCITQEDKIIKYNMHLRHEINVHTGNTSSGEDGDGVVPQDMDGEKSVSRRLSKSTSQLPDPTTPGSPVKIRRLSSRKSHTTERYKRIYKIVNSFRIYVYSAGYIFIFELCTEMLYDDESDGFNDEFEQEYEEEEEKIEPIVKKRRSSDGFNDAVKVRSERPKKPVYACPHTDKPYYAKVCFYFSIKFKRNILSYVLHPG